MVKGEKERTIIISGLYLYGIDAISVEEMKWKILFELFVQIIRIILFFISMWFDALCCSG